MPELTPPAETETVTAKLTSEQQQRFSFYKDLVRLLGDDVVAIVLYGSAAKEKNLKNCHDYDLNIVVEDGSLPRIYPKITGKRFVHIDGKQIGVNLTEKSSYTKSIRFNHDPREFREQSLVLYGSVDYPMFSEQEIRERQVCSTILRAKTIKSAAAWISQDPELLLGKEDLFGYFQKTLRLIYNSALNLEHGYRLRSKAELNNGLHQLGMQVLPYRQDPKILVDSILQAAVWASALTDMYLKGKRFEDGFFLRI